GLLQGGVAKREIVEAALKRSRQIADAHRADRPWQGDGVLLGEGGEGASIERPRLVLGTVQTLPLLRRQQRLQRIPDGVADPGRKMAQAGRAITARRLVPGLVLALPLLLAETGDLDLALGGGQALEPLLHGRRLPANPLLLAQLLDDFQPLVPVA